MDFAERLAEKIESMNLDMPTVVGKLDTEESVAIVPIGGQVVRAFFDGEQDVRMSVDFTVKTKDQLLAINTLNDLANRLTDLQDLESNNESFIYRKFDIQDMPTFNGLDEQGWFIYRMTATADITTF